ncbi:MAG: hypothetical protein ACETVQ_04155 [Candidatus Bathyarchaeia archaeon]
MVEKSKENLVFAFTILLVTIWLILSRNTWDFVTRLLLVGAIVPIIWALLKREKNKLNLAITLLASLGIAWLIWIENVSILHGLPLLVFAIVAVKWILRDKAKPSRLLGFFVKTFTLFLMGTGVAYFIVWLGITAPYTYGVYTIHAIVETGMVFIFPISLLLEAISIIIYGIFKIKLRAWEIFLASWYVSIFVILVIYAVWLILYPPWKPGKFYYTTFAASIAPLIPFPYYALLPAAICTIVYIKYKKPQIQKTT